MQSPLALAEYSQHIYSTFFLLLPDVVVVVVAADLVVLPPRYWSLSSSTTTVQRRLNTPLKTGRRSRKRSKKTSEQLSIESIQFSFSEAAPRDELLPLFRADRSAVEPPAKSLSHISPERRVCRRARNPWGERGFFSSNAWFAISRARTCLDQAADPHSNPLPTSFKIFSRNLASTHTYLRLHAALLLTVPNMSHFPPHPHWSREGLGCVHAFAASAAEWKRPAKTRHNEWQEEVEVSRTRARVCVCVCVCKWVWIPLSGCVDWVEIWGLNRIFTILEKHGASNAFWQMYNTYIPCVSITMSENMSTHIQK